MAPDNFSVNLAGATLYHLPNVNTPLVFGYAVWLYGEIIPREHNQQADGEPEAKAEEAPSGTPFVPFPLFSPPKINPAYTQIFLHFADSKHTH